jgi:hypothetical protein
MKGKLLFLEDMKDTLRESKTITKITFSCFKAYLWLSSTFSSSYFLPSFSFYARLVLARRKRMEKGGKKGNGEKLILLRIWKFRNY